jgi:hypothetical protein
MYRVGSQADRRNQIVHLVEMSHRPNVDLRLIRFEDGPQPGMCGPINIFDFPDDEDPSIVFMETDTEVREVTSPEEARAYIDALARVRSGSLAPAATTAYLEKLAGTLEVSSQ